MPQPFAGVRVIELGGTLAVAGSTKTFADFGADVIKLEPPTGGELRRLPPFPDDVPGLNRGAYHLALDTGKRSVVLDCTTPSGVAVLLAIARGCDLLMLHLPPADSIEVLSAVSSSLGSEAPSTVSLAVHGLEGPFARRQDDDLSLFASSNRMFRHSFTNEEPLRYGPNVATMQWAMTATAVAAAAIWGRRHDGVRRSVEVAGVEALGGSVDSWFVPWSLTGAETPRQAGPSRAGYPTGYIPCKDGYLLLSAGTEPFFSRFCKGIGHPELATDRRFTDPAEKPAHYDEFMKYVDAYLSARTRVEAFTELQSHGVMCAPLLDVSEAFGDRQAIARGSFVEVAQPGLGAITIAGAPFKMQDGWRAAPAPDFGAHTAEVLRAAGYTPDEQLALFRAGVTG